jgi:hypothetical protein
MFVIAECPPLKILITQRGRPFLFDSQYIRAKINLWYVMLRACEFIQACHPEPVEGISTLPI